MSIVGEYTQYIYKAIWVRYEMSGLIEAFGSRTGLIMFTKSVFHFRLQPELFLIAGEQEATGTNCNTTLEVSGRPWKTLKVFGCSAFAGEGGMEVISRNSQTNTLQQDGAKVSIGRFC